MKTSDFYYDLPEELIAQDPLEDRSSSRLMTVDKETGKIGHHVFSEIIDYLNEGDCLVINDTKVIPARLIGAKEETGAKIEVLLLKRGADDVWETLVKPGRKAKPGTRISFRIRTDIIRFMQNIQVQQPLRRQDFILRRNYLEKLKKKALILQE